MSDARAVAIEARGLVRRFDDGQRVIEVLCELDIVVEAGESVAVVGESGVGKSTLLHVLGALDIPDSGSVMLEGQDLLRLAPKEIACQLMRRWTNIRNREFGGVRMR